MDWADEIARALWEKVPAGYESESVPLIAAALRAAYKRGYEAHKDEASYLT